jgi:hypothetical protein
MKPTDWKNSHLINVVVVVVIVVVVVVVVSAATGVVAVLQSSYHQTKSY